MNITLTRLFGSEWGDERYGNFNGKEMHMAYDICKVLGLSNSTIAIRGSAGICNVSSKHRIMEMVEDWNPIRTVHLLTIDGVFQMILNNKSAECRRIKDYLVASVLPSSIFRFQYQTLTVIP